MVKKWIVVATTPPTNGNEILGTTQQVMKTLGYNFSRYLKDEKFNQ
jgi:hypothetical protein